jgi:hypothetical protein
MNIELPLAFMPLIVEHLGYLFLSIIFLGTGLYVQIKRPGDVASTLLFWCGPHLLGLGANAVAQYGLTSAIFPAIAAVTIGPWLLVHFFLVLPQERTRLRRSRLIYLLYLPAVVTVLLVPFSVLMTGSSSCF